MNTTQFSIGQLARQVKCKVETVHYYEKSGLMREPPRTEGGHRIYALSQIKRLTLISRCRVVGLVLTYINELLRCNDEP